MKTITVRLVPLGKEIQVKEGISLLDVLHGYGVEFPCGGKGTCGRCKVRLLEGEIERDQNHHNKLNELGLEPEWRLACLSNCDSDLSLEVGQYETIIQGDDTEFEFTPSQGLGIAFDLGTTTLVGQLIDLATGKILAVETALNPQRKFGSDLISRLESALQNGGEEQSRMIRAKMAEMIGRMLPSGVKAERMVIVGNTVMHHLFSGFDITPLSFFPFDSPQLGMAAFTPANLGWKGITCDHVDFYPSIGSFVGSDILAGILATGMHLKDTYSVLIDLGTNGEIVVGNKEGLLCASTAAGPAFEGAKISQGMQATTGAISSISMEEGVWNCSVIGNVKSQGICGSGLIDAISLFLEGGLIGMFGEIESGETEIQLDSRVSLTQKDIQEFQLAKAAISAGIEILLNKKGIEHHQVEDVYIAGGFGTYINLENVIRTGMLRCSVERMHKLGNSALIGAKMFLFEGTGAAEGILDITQHVSLESEAGFQDIFVDHLVLQLPGD